MRAEILEASNRLVDYSYSLQNCSESELESLQSEIRKEVNKIISNVYGLAPFLDNPHIVGGIAEIMMVFNPTLEDLRPDSKIMKDAAAQTIRNVICPIANMTRLKLTPKSFKNAYGVKIGVKDILTLKGFYEHQQNNY